MNAGKSTYLLQVAHNYKENGMQVLLLTSARPSLVAMSGQSATFLAGGEVPIPVPSSVSNPWRVVRISPMMKRKPS